MSERDDYQSGDIGKFLKNHEKAMKVAKKEREELLKKARQKQDEGEVKVYMTAFGEYFSNRLKEVFYAKDNALAGPGLQLKVEEVAQKVEDSIMTNVAKKLGVETKEEAMKKVGEGALFVLALAAAEGYIKYFYYSLRGYKDNEFNEKFLKSQQAFNEPLHDTFHRISGIMNNVSFDNVALLKVDLQGLPFMEKNGKVFEYSKLLSERDALTLALEFESMLERMNNLGISNLAKNILLQTNHVGEMVELKAYPMNKRGLFGMFANISDLFHEIAEYAEAPMYLTKSDVFTLSKLISKYEKEA